MCSVRPSLFLPALFFLNAAAAPAHDIPSDATLHMFVKPISERLQLLVRVPLKTIRDLDFPERERGYLDIEKLAPRLPDAATVWISDFVEIYEGKIRLPRPRVVATQVSIQSDRSFASFEEALAHITGPKLANMFASRARFPPRPGLWRRCAGARISGYRPQTAELAAITDPNDPERLCKSVCQAQLPPGWGRPTHVCRAGISRFCAVPGPQRSTDGIA